MKTNNATDSGIGYVEFCTEEDARHAWAFVKTDERIELVNTAPRNMKSNETDTEEAEPLEALPEGIPPVENERQVMSSITNELVETTPEISKGK